VICVDKKIFPWERSGCRFELKGELLVPTSVQQTESHYGYSGGEFSCVRFLNGERTTAANTPQART
jgi:hypothetical protein